MSGEYETNPVLWLATQVGKLLLYMYLILYDFGPELLLNLCWN